jgi:hypothetical protein
MERPSLGRVNQQIVIPSEQSERGNLPPTLERGDCHEPNGSRNDERMKRGDCHEPNGSRNDERMKQGDCHGLFQALQ